MLGLPRGDIVAGHLGDVDAIVGAGDEDLEPLEQASCLRGLGACVPNEYVRPDADVLKPLDQRCVEGKGQEPGRGLLGTERSIPALMAPLPRTLECIAWGLPLMELPLPDLP